MDEQQRAEVRERRDEQQRAEVRERIPPRFRGADMRDFDPQQQPLAVRLAKWCHTFPNVRRGLYIHGLPGVGKTHLAAAVLNEVGEGHWLRFGDFVRSMQHSYRVKDERSPYALFYREMYAHRLFVLDDVGKHLGTEWRRDLLCEIVETAYEDRQFVVMTSEMSPEALPLPAGVRGRILEMTHSCRMGGPDRRVAHRVR